MGLKERKANILRIDGSTYIIFFPVMIARSPLIVPGSEASGLVAPIIFRLRNSYIKAKKIELVIE